LWEGGRVVSKRGVVELVDKNTEEGSGVVVRVGPQLRVDVYDERGGNGGKQTSLVS
jgi:hypothetical protein